MTLRRHNGVVLHAISTNTLLTEGDGSIRIWHASIKISTNTLLTEGDVTCFEFDNDITHISTNTLLTEGD